MRPPARQVAQRSPAARGVIAAWPGVGAGARERAWLGDASLSVTVRLPADGRPLAGVVVAQSGQCRESPGRAGAGRHGSGEPELRAGPAGHPGRLRGRRFPTATRSATRSIRSRRAKRFQLPLYRGKPYPPVRFDQAGTGDSGLQYPRLDARLTSWSPMRPSSAAPTPAAPGPPRSPRRLPRFDLASPHARATPELERRARRSRDGDAQGL